MNTEELVRHRMRKFRSIGVGLYKEDGQVEPEKKRGMKPSEVNVPKTGEIENQLEDLKMKILEAKGPFDPMTSEAIEKVEEELNQEMTKAFISMGLQDQVESLKLELARAPSNQSLGMPLKEKADKIVREFKRNLSRPGAYLRLKQKLQTLTTVMRLIEVKEKKERLKSEINQKITPELRAKADRYKNTLEKSLKGDSSDHSSLAEGSQMLKQELEHVLKSANLEIVAISKRKDLPASPDVKEKVNNLSKEISREIESAADRAGVQEKIQELREEILRDSRSEKVKKLEAEIKKGIASALGVNPLKEKAENLRKELATYARTTTVEDEVRDDNVR